MKYAAIINDTIYHEGDERSHTNPGHGYPAYTESVKRFHPFESKEAMLKWVENQGRGSRTFTIIQYEEMEVVTTINVRSSS